MNGVNLKVARNAYRMHKVHCRGRLDREGNKVEMLLSFDEWLRTWLHSGMWNLRGNSAAKPYQMCRYNDLGSYALGNIYIGTKSDNMRDMHSWYDKAAA